MNLELLLSRLLILFTLLTLPWIIYSASLLTTQQPVAWKIRLFPGPRKTNNQPSSFPHSISQSLKSVKSGYVNGSQQAGALKIRLSQGPSKKNNRPGDAIPHDTSQSQKRVKSGCVDCSIIDKVVERPSQNQKEQEQNSKKISIIDKVVERPSQNQKEQEQNSKKISIIDKVVERPLQKGKKKVQNRKKMSIIDKVVERYSQNWMKQVQNYQKFRALLSSTCNGATKAVVTQANTPLGSNVTYDGHKNKQLEVTPDLFSLFPEESPFGKTTRDTCAVVGNGGILVNSSCGEKIDSAQFVIRCNLPPLEHGYEKDVGIKANLVTANPSILFRKFGGLRELQEQPFVDRLRPYDDALVPLPAFSYSTNTEVSLRAVYALKKFRSSARPVFLNPQYLMNLTQFWNSQGLNPQRLSSGLMMASLALELCTNVDLYGFWPFSQHPYGHHTLTNHYYDDVPFRKKAHAMPDEFDQLLRLHEQGILRLHLGQCPPSDG